MVLCSALALAPGSARAVEQSGALVFVMNLPVSLLGEGAATIIEQLNTLRKDVATKTGLQIDMRPQKSWDAVLDMLRNRRADVAWLPPTVYVRAGLQGIGLTPLATFESRRKTTTATCLYVTQESGIKTLDQMVDTNIAVPDETEWVLLNIMMRDEKNPIPAKQFFGRIRVMTRESAALAVVFRKLNGVVMDTSSIQYVRRRTPRLKQLTPVACTSQGYPMGLIVAQKDLSKNTARQVQLLVLGMHNDPVFGNLRDWFAPTDGRWVRVKTDSYQVWRHVYREAYDAGWLREFRSLEQE